MKLQAIQKSMILLIAATIMNVLTASARQHVQAPPPPKPPTPQNGGNFIQVEHHANFPGGFKAFTSYLTRSMEYPKIAVQKKIQGKVFITFVVERDGTLTNVRVLRGIGGGCDEEAVKIVKSSPKWIPAKQKGQIVRSMFTMPVDFTLNKA